MAVYRARIHINEEIEFVAPNGADPEEYIHQVIANSHGQHFKSLFEDAVEIIHVEKVESDPRIDTSMDLE